MPRKRKEHRFNEGIEEKHCNNCHKWKLLKAYNKDKRASDNLGSWCKTCSNAGKKKRRQKLTEEGRERERAQCRKSMKKRRMNGKGFDWNACASVIKKRNRIDNMICII